MKANSVAKPKAGSLEWIESGALANMHIHSISDLWFYPPLDYFNFSEVSQTFNVVSGEPHIYCAKLLNKPRSGKIRHSLVANIIDTNGQQSNVMVFDYRFGLMKVGDYVFLKGQFNYFDNRLVLSNVEFIPRYFIGRIIPRYKTTAKINTYQIFETLCNNTDTLAPTISTMVERIGMTEKNLLEKIESSFSSLHEILMSMHFPENEIIAQRAQSTLRRIAALEVVRTIQRNKKQLHNPNSIIQIDDSLVTKLAQSLPYQLTNDQQRAIKEINTDLRSPAPMSRLVSGDVGYGKSAVIQIPALAAQAAQAKVAIMTCNALLVDQLYDEFLLIQPNANLRKVYGLLKIDAIEGNPIMIGTTAILSKLEKLGWHPDLLIVDEQEKFSREQREKLNRTHTNVLEATATCIPRTGALVTHGIMDVSVLTQCPVVKNTDTYVVGPHKKTELLEGIKRRVQSGEQVAIIYPIVETDNDEDYRRNVVQMFGVWEKMYPGRVGCLHGRMQNEEKFAVIKSLKEKAYDLLVASSVIERGITLPSLTTLVIVNAERYGLAQLHQIRGRLARHGGEGKLFLLAGKDISADALKRLKILASIKDGFKLAEMDMMMRGYGDLHEDSESQHGKSISHLFKHIKLLPQDFVNLN